MRVVGSSNMNILMVISQFHPIVGGAEKQAELLAQTLSAKRIRVSLVTGWWSLKTRRNEQRDGFRVFRNFSCWGMFGIKGFRPLGGLTYMVSLAAYLIVHRKQYDLIHVHQALHPAFVSVLVGKFLRKPVLVKYACSGLTSDINQLKGYPFGDLQLNYLVKAMDCLVAVSQDGVEEVRSMGYPGSKIVHIPNGVLVPSEGKVNYHRVRRVLTAARLSKQKGIDVLLTAWEKVVQERRDLELFILGQGPAESELKDLSLRLGLSASVRFLGLTYEIGKYMREADLFVLPSRAEGLSNALLEAMSYGIPSIATNLPSNAELLIPECASIPHDGFGIAKNGLLFNAEDAQGLAQAILHFLRNPNDREEMAKRGRDFVRSNYSIDHIADKYVDLYQRLLGGIS